MFLDFDLDMCFSPQGRAIFPHPHFHKWSETVSFLAFWLDNALCATAGRHFPHPNFRKWCEYGVFCAFWLGNALRAAVAWYFSTSQLPKVVRASRVLYLLSWKCASRHSGVPFFHIRTSKSGACFLPFESKICFAPARRATFHFSSNQMSPRPPLWGAYFSTLRAHKYWKTQNVLRLSEYFAHLYVLSSDSFSFGLLLFSSTPLFPAFHFSILPEVRLLNLLRLKFTQVAHRMLSHKFHA